jgi:hypothetical protein
MSTSTLSNNNLSYTYTTIPNFDTSMVGYYDSNTTLPVPASSGGITAFNALSITITNPGVYLCEGNIGYETPGGNVTVFTSLSTSTATLDTTNQVTGITSTTDNTNVRTTAVITIADPNTPLYCVGQTPDTIPGLGIANGFIKYTRIA